MLCPKVFFEMYSSLLCYWEYHNLPFIGGCRGGGGKEKETPLWAHSVKD